MEGVDPPENVLQAFKLPLRLWKCACFLWIVSDSDYYACEGAHILDTYLKFDLENGGFQDRN